MIASMTTTNVLAVLIGLYFVSGGLFLITDSKAANSLVKEFVGQPVLTYLAGLVVFTIGGVIIAVHFVWDNLLAGFISLVGLIALLEGVALIAFPKWFLGLFASLDFPGAVVKGFGVATLLIGLVLLWTGLAS